MRCLPAGFWRLMLLLASFLFFSFLFFSFLFASFLFFSFLFFSFLSIISIEGFLIRRGVPGVLIWFDCVCLFWKQVGYGACHRISGGTLHAAVRLTRKKQVDHFDAIVVAFEFKLKTVTFVWFVLNDNFDSNEWNDFNFQCCDHHRRMRATRPCCGAGLISLGSRTCPPSCSG